MNKDQDKKLRQASDAVDALPSSMPETPRTPGSTALASALDAVQRMAAESDAEQASDDVAEEMSGSIATGVCRSCGYQNREGNKFCAKCGSAILSADEEESLAMQPDDFGRPPAVPQYFDRESEQGMARPTGRETHHYHHHYHHHYFPGGAEAAYPRSGDSVREPERLRPATALRGERGDMSRAETAVRRVTHEWAMACNTKHLDDLLDLYIADAFVLRSNHPPVRGSAAIREFFFGGLDAGLGEIEFDPLRIEVVGDLAYEAGRFKALVPGATGKRREERGKYLWVCARQTGGEWKLAADCWSSDLTLTTAESDVPVSTGVRTSQPRKTP